MPAIAATEKSGGAKATILTKSRGLDAITLFGQLSAWFSPAEHSDAQWSSAQYSKASTGPIGASWSAVS
jgi:hypothetical protein